MPNSKQIVYLSQAQYAELIANGTITVDGVTVTYDENDIYVTPQAEPVTDVRINGASIAANGVANIPMATATTAGAIIVGDGLQKGSTKLLTNPATAAQIKAGIKPYEPIVSSTQHISAFYGLAKAAGHDEASSTEPLGTYTPEAKGAIQQMLGVSDLIATAENNLVASKAYAVGDIFTANGKLYKATAAIAADGAIVLQNEGETVSGANAIQCKLGEETIKDVQINGVSVLNNGVANVPVANNSGFGAIKLGDGFSTDNTTLKTNVDFASADNIKAGASQKKAITPYAQHRATFYGLAKAAGDTTQSQSSNAVGQYTDTAKTAIRAMLGATSSNVIAVQDTQPTDTDTKIWLPETAETPVTVPTVAEMESALAGKVGDVQVNGTSVVSNGIANVPVASSSVFGAIQVGAGLYMTSSGKLVVNRAQLSDIKAGLATSQYSPITPADQHSSVFYGLAKASGDTTQSASSNAVGTYTDNAKASIKAMLGIVDGSTGTVDVTGATPTITAVENTRYVCGEVTSLNFTPAASGICIVRFTSGSTVTVLTLPSTVKFPEWFDPTSLETNTIYEICVTDGIYGAVMLWAL